MKEQIEQLAERFETLGAREQLDVRTILTQYVEGEIELDEMHYTLLDEELIPMPSRCTMYLDFVTLAPFQHLETYIDDLHT